MQIDRVEVVHAWAGWRPWTFIRIDTAQGLTGYADASDSFGSSRGVAAVVAELTPRLLGRDPRSWEALRQDLFRLTRQSRGGVVQKAIGGIENALLDLTAKSYGLPVHRLFGGPLREDMRVYWSHCGTTRVRSPGALDRPPLRTLEDVRALGAEVRERGFTALKTNALRLASEPSVLMQGFRGGLGSFDQNLPEGLTRELRNLFTAFREGAGEACALMLDLNHHLKAPAVVEVAEALESARLAWLEVDVHDAATLRDIRDRVRVPIASGENLLERESVKRMLDHGGVDVVVVDVLWQGLAEARRIADLAALFERNVAPHNHQSPLGTLISAHFCASIPNLAMLEIDVDDVPWASEILSAPLRIEGGRLTLTEEPGWGADLVMEALEEHAWAA